MGEGPRMRLRSDDTGRTVIVFDRMPLFESDEIAQDWAQARERLCASGLIPLRFTFEIEIED